MPNERNIDMYIKPLICSCGNLSFSGDGGSFSAGGSQATSDNFATWHCQCGRKYALTEQEYIDQSVISSPFSGLVPLANHTENGSFTFEKGGWARVSFAKKFDIIGMVGGSPFYTSSTYYSTAGFVMTFPKKEDTFYATLPIKEQTYNWTAIGMSNINALPLWRVLFYEAMVLGTRHMMGLVGGSLKLSLIQYASSFEAFLNANLNERFQRNGNPELGVEWRNQRLGIESQFRLLLPTLINTVASKEVNPVFHDVYKAWKQHVNEPRNTIIHSKVKLDVTYEKIEAAHRATYQAIRWIQDN